MTHLTELKVVSMFVIILLLFNLILQLLYELILLPDLKGRRKKHIFQNLRHYRKAAGEAAGGVISFMMTDTFLPNTTPLLSSNSLKPPSTH